MEEELLVLTYLACVTAGFLMARLSSFSRRIQVKGTARSSSAKPPSKKERHATALNAMPQAQPHLNGLGREPHEVAAGSAQPLDEKANVMSATRCVVRSALFAAAGLLLEDDARRHVASAIREAATGLPGDCHDRLWALVAEVAAFAEAAGEVPPALAALRKTAEAEALSGDHLRARTQTFSMTGDEDEEGSVVSSCSSESVARATSTRSSCHSARSRCRSSLEFRFESLGTRDSVASLCLSNRASRRSSLAARFDALDGKCDCGDEAMQVPSVSQSRRSSVARRADACRARIVSFSRDTLVRDVERAPHSAQAWMALADLFQDDTRDVVVMGVAYGEEGVLLKALEVNPHLAAAYAELATVVGTRAAGYTVHINGSPFDVKALHCRALELNPLRTASYDDLADWLVQGETASIGGRDFTSEELREASQKLHAPPANPSPLPKTPKAPGTCPLLPPAGKLQIPQIFGLADAPSASPAGSPRPPISARRARAATAPVEEHADFRGVDAWTPRDYGTVRTRKTYCAPEQGDANRPPASRWEVRTDYVALRTDDPSHHRALRERGATQDELWRSPRRFLRAQTMPEMQERHGSSDIETGAEDVRSRAATETFAMDDGAGSDGQSSDGLEDFPGTHVDAGRRSQNRSSLESRFDALDGGGAALAQQGAEEFDV